MKNDLVFRYSLIPNDVTKLCNDLYHGFIESAFSGDVSNPVKVLADYFKKNPLKISMLDPDPELKAEILKVAGMRDVSKLSRILNNKLY